MSPEDSNRDEIETQVSLYLDGELAPAEAEVVGKLISDSNEWKACYDDMRRTSHAVEGYFKKSEDVLTSDGEGSRQAVQRIVRESTMTLRRSQVRRLGVDRLLSRRRLVLFIALGLVGLTILLISLFHDEGESRTPQELLGVAADRLDTSSFDVRLADGEFDALKQQIFGDLAEGVTSLRLWESTAGRFHLRLMDSTGTRHVGFDGKVFWNWKTGDSVVRTASKSDQDPWIDAAERLRDRWRRARTAVRDLAGDGDVELEEVNGVEWLTAVVNGDPLRAQIESNGVIDVLEHIGLVVKENKSAEADFEIDNWAAGVPVEEMR